MQDERNANQIIRKDARNCFVESLSDTFSNGRAHFAFATYDMNKPAGQRQTNNIHIYISVPELLELCRKLSCGELRYIMQQKKQDMLTMMEIWFVVRVVLYLQYDTSKDFLQQFQYNAENLLKLLDDIPRLKRMVRHAR